MNFISTIFWISLVLVYIIWKVFIRKNTEKLFLLCSSLSLYTLFYPIHALNIILVSASTYYITKKISKLRIVFSIFLNLSHLLFYKYTTYFLPSSLIFSSPSFNLIIPIGISFYTFQNLSYIFDINKNKNLRYHRFTDYLLYISFFPQLVAGPIVRSNFFAAQINRKRKTSIVYFFCGLERIFHGLFLKLVIADNLSILVNQNWNQTYYIENGSQLPFYLIIAFGCQIFGDFAGYSLIAIGIALMFGIILPRNFRSPYISGSLSKFWQRWHRTLSKWIRDYLYIPLGGNRGSKTKITIIIVFVMVVSGIWHGNTFSFAIWGFLHGIALAVDRYISMQLIKFNTIKSIRLLNFIQAKFCFITVMVLWIFFREQNIFHALLIFRSLILGDFILGEFYNLLLSYPIAFYSIIAVILIHIFSYLRQFKSYSRISVINRFIICVFCVLNCLLLHGNSSNFIYFRF